MQSQPHIPERYEIIKRLGVGTQGTVFHARDKVLDREVAIKVLHAPLILDEKHRQRMEREARIAASTNHPNVVVIYDISMEDDPFIAMEYLPQSLADKIRREAPLPIPESIEFAIEMAEGLAAVHEKGVIHRDVKPENVLIDASGHAKMTDFGISLTQDATGASYTISLGTPDFMAPEQWNRQDPDQRSDIYSLGCVLYQMLTGMPPFEGDDPIQKMRRHVEEASPSVRDTREEVPEGINQIVARAMEKDPNDRFQTMREFSAALRAIAQRADRYEILEKLGEGSQGTVYRARDKVLGREVALKVLQPQLAMNDKYRERLQREARIAASTRHPNVVTIYDIAMDVEQPFIALEYLPQTLSKKIAAEGPFSVDDSIDYAIEVAEGLGAVHKEGVIHRDVKPDNVLIDSDGHAKVTDFGISLSEDTLDASFTTSIGTPDYMSPEQWNRGAIDQRSDVYSLGGVIFYMLTNKTPFEGNFVQLMQLHTSEPAPSVRERREDVPMALDGVIRRAMEKNPADRFQSMGEMVAALKAVRAPVLNGPNWMRRALFAVPVVIVLAAAAFFGPRLLPAESSPTVTPPPPTPPITFAPPTTIPPTPPVPSTATVPVGVPLPPEPTATPTSTPASPVIRDIIPGVPIALDDRTNLAQAYQLIATGCELPPEFGSLVVAESWEAGSDSPMISFDQPTGSNAYVVVLQGVPRDPQTDWTLSVIVDKPGTGGREQLLANNTTFPSPVAVPIPLCPQRQSLPVELEIEEQNFHWKVLLVVEGGEGTPLRQSDKELRDVVANLYTCDTLPDSSEMQLQFLTGSNIQDNRPVRFDVVESASDVGRPYVLAIDFRPKEGVQNWFFNSNIKRGSVSDEGPTVPNQIGEKIGLRSFCTPPKSIVVSFASGGGDWDLFLIKKKEDGAP